jgi:hypothetical protein
MEDFLNPTKVRTGITRFVAEYGILHRYILGQRVRPTSIRFELGTDIFGKIYRKHCPMWLARPTTVLVTEQDTLTRNLIDYCFVEL